MKEIRVQDAVGHALVHDIVRIVIGEVKDTPFRRGHVITEADVPKLLDLGKEHIYVMEPEDEGFLHEEDVALYSFISRRTTSNRGSKNWWTYLNYQTIRTQNNGHRYNRVRSI